MRHEPLRQKFYGLRKNDDGSFVKGWYFVLREGDKHIIPSLLAYAESCRIDNPILAEDLRNKVEELCTPIRVTSEKDML